MLLPPYNHLSFASYTQQQLPTHWLLYQSVTCTSEIRRERHCRFPTQKFVVSHLHIPHLQRTAVRQPSSRQHKYKVHGMVVLIVMLSPRVSYAIAICVAPSNRALLYTFGIRRWLPGPPARSVTCLCLLNPFAPALTQTNILFLLSPHPHPMLRRQVLA